ncbi:MAG: carbohydrate kinase family protein [Anaerolineales bacterium]
MAAPLCLLLGRLQRDTIITADGAARIDQLGGNLLYAAAACRLLGGKPGLVTRVGNDFPRSWLEEISEKDCDVQGVRLLGQPQDLRRFIAYNSLYEITSEHPVKQFAAWGLPFPKSLLQYPGRLNRLDSKKERSPLTLRPDDLPEVYRGARVAHCCPMDFLSHSLMPAALRQLGATQVTLEAGDGYMHPEFWNEIPDLVNGLTLFRADESRLRALFGARTDDLWGMIEAIAAYNCAAVLVQRQARGYLFYTAADRTRYQLPAYPARTFDLTDKGSSFCGAFAAELARTQDLRRALLVAAALASLAAEGSGAFYVLDTLPGLVESRAQVLGDALKVI